VFDDFWLRDEEVVRKGWGAMPYCALHHRAALEKAIRLRDSELVGSNARMRSFTLATFPSDDEVGATAKQAAMRWLQEFWEDVDARLRLYIWGGVGSGKTSLAFSLARATIADHPYDEIRFVNVRQFLAEIRRAYGTDKAIDPIPDLIDADLLVLDDLGSERVTDWARETIATLVEGRYVAERPIITTSNYKPSELARRLGHDDPVIGLRIVSRLTENATVIHLDRPDLRLRSRNGDEAVS
jgi:DNA replication protein DnaC